MKTDVVKSCRIIGIFWEQNKYAPGDQGNYYPARNSGRYGNYSYLSLDFNNLFFYREQMYVQFDISDFLNKKLKGFTLILQRKLISGENTRNQEGVLGPAIAPLLESGYLGARLESFVSTKKPLLDYFDGKDEGSAVKIVVSKTVNDGVVSGQVRHDITGLITDNCINEGIIGIKFSVGSGFIQEDHEHIYLEIQYEDITALAPTNLYPLYTQNPAAPIQFGWAHSPNPFFADDPQIGSELSIWQGNNVLPTIYQDNTENTYILPQNTFSDYSQEVGYQIRTKTEFNGFSSLAYGSFNLGRTPPGKSAIIFPPEGKILNASSDIMLNWEYNSPYRDNPLKFDVRYKIDNAAYTEVLGIVESTFKIPAMILDSYIVWQVKAYGQWGDEGEWSDESSFRVMGKPKTPALTYVTNSNKPQIGFFIPDNSIIALRIMISENSRIVYDSQNIAFNGNLSHSVKKMLNNGNYTASLIVINSQGTPSDKSTYGFTINTTSPPALNLTIVNNLDYFTRLRFDNYSQKMVYIYRDNLLISKTNSDYYDDYSAKPQVKHKYFVRIVNDSGDFGFSDSNIESFELEFIDTTIAFADTPDDMLKLKFMLDGKPKKSFAYNKDKSFVNFIGRKKPVFLMGEHENQSISYTFYCKKEEYQNLLCFLKVQRY